MPLHQYDIQRWLLDDTPSTPEEARRIGAPDPVEGSERACGDAGWCIHECVECDEPVLVRKRGADETEIMPEIPRWLRLNRLTGAAAAPHGAGPARRGRLIRP